MLVDQAALVAEELTVLILLINELNLNSFDRCTQLSDKNDRKVLAFEKLKVLNRYFHLKKSVAMNAFFSNGMISSILHQSKKNQSITSVYLSFQS